MRQFLFILLFCITGMLAHTTQIQAQDSAMDSLLNQGLNDEPQYAFATFKANRIINGQSVEQMRAKHMLFLIQHRFSTGNEGWYDLFGLDGATIRLGFDYGVTDWLTVGVGRSSYQKSYDGYGKLRFLRQTTGTVNMPITASIMGSAAVQTLRRPPDPEGRELPFRSRMAYTWQLLVARKWNGWLSTQLSPTFVHRNLVRTPAEENDLFSLGMGARIKFHKRAALLVEYFWTPEDMLPRDNTQTGFEGFHNPFAIGFDIETGGHVFQLHFTNASAMIERAFIGETTSNFFGNQIRFGFNIHRTFSLEGK